jgi:hypothetical protein
MDIQPFPRIHAVLEPTDPLVVIYSRKQGYSYFTCMAPFLLADNTGGGAERTAPTRARTAGYWGVIKGV